MKYNVLIILTIDNLIRKRKNKKKTKEKNPSKTKKRGSRKLASSYMRVILYKEPL